MEKCKSFCFLFLKSPSVDLIPLNVTSKAFGSTLFDFTGFDSSLRGRVKYTLNHDKEQDEYPEKESHST